MKCTTIKALSWLLAALTIGVLTASAADKKLAEPPDLTQGGKKDDSHDWQLGPTGARGWIFFRSDDLTAVSRQILITAVDPGSPADGILRPNDVILGVADKPFSDDARKSFGRAITTAEEKSGVLSLIRWREGKSANVDLKLSVLGAYSDTTPYDCPKSKKIFEQGCQLIAKQGLKDPDIPIHFNALALLATGKQEYRPMLAAYARKVAASLQQDTWNWFVAYGNLFLAEYALATGDKSILPELKRTCMLAVKNQCMNGMWGHAPSLANGHSEGYGGMNQIGLPMTMALVLARQVGVTDPAIDQAIDRSLALLCWYVHKGSIPYGDHECYPSHENNGMCSCMAVLSDLRGDGEATLFFSRMATAAYDVREYGHCGNYWSMLWALPGVSCGGQLATGAYMKEQGWYYDLARNWKGGFVYQKIEKGQENDNYTNWDLTGSYLMSFGLPLKSLYILGKKPCSLPAWKANEVKEVIAAGRDYYPQNDRNAYYARKTADLLAGLSSWSPGVRCWSARALGKREGDFVPALLKLVAGSDRYSRYGALEALRCLGSRADAVAPQLRAALKDPDLWIKCLACYAMAYLSPGTCKACLNDLLALAASKNRDDPRGMVNRAVSKAVFSPYPGTRTPTILGHSLEGIDRSLLVPAMAALLQNDDGEVRSSVGAYLNKLTDRDVALLLPEIIKAIEQQAPSDEMFADGIRQAGLNLLSRLHIREGMELCVSTLEWRWGVEYKPRLGYLLRYGVNAKQLVPELRKRRPDWPEGAKAVDKCIADIEASKESPTLVSLKDFIAKASAGGDASNNTKKGTP